MADDEIEFQWVGWVPVDADIAIKNIQNRIDHNNGKAIGSDTDIGECLLFRSETI